MIDKEDITKKIATLENLKQSVILKHTDKIEFDNEIELYDKLIEEFFAGKLDDDYDNPLFDNVDENTKKKILKNVRKFQNLCFYENSKEFWMDSVEDVPVEDYNLIAYQLLDNFDFLLKLYMTGGEDALLLLNNYSSSKFRNIYLSTVENIRRNFVNDNVLFDVFKNLSDEDSLFSIFTDNEKNALLEYPEGTLYFYSKDGVEIIDPMFIALELYYRVNGKSYELSSRDEFIKVSSELTGFFKNEDGFLENVSEMFFEYQNKLNLESDFEIVNDKIINGINLVNLRDNWIIQDEGLLLDINNSINMSLK